MTLTTSDDTLSLELHGREQFWAMRAKIKVPAGTIKNIHYEPEFQDWRKWEVRMPGTHAPKLLLAGSYWTEEGWDFLYIKRPVGFIKPKVTSVLVIETDQNRYCRIVVSVDEAEGKKVIDWWKKFQSKNSKSKK